MHRIKYAFRSACTLSQIYTKSTSTITNKTLLQAGRYTQTTKNCHSQINPALSLASIADRIKTPFPGRLKDGSEVEVHHMTEPELQEMYRLYREAASKGVGFSIHEWPTEKDFRANLVGGLTFAIRRKSTGSMVGALSLIPSTESYCPSVMFIEPTLIVPEDQRSTGIGKFTEGAVKTFTQCLGVLGTYTRVLANNTAIVNYLEKTGHQRVADFPLGAMMPDGSFVGRYIYFKDLRDTN